MTSRNRKQKAFLNDRPYGKKLRETASGKSNVLYHRSFPVSLHQIRITLGRFLNFPVNCNKANGVVSLHSPQVGLFDFPNSVYRLLAERLAGHATGERG
jgi:hypothetical protein